MANDTNPSALANTLAGANDDARHAARNLAAQRTALTLAVSSGHEAAILLVHVGRIAEVEAELSSAEAVIEALRGLGA